MAQGMPRTPRKSNFTARYEMLRGLLIEARENAALSQAELAARLNRPQSFVSKYERGERRIDVEEFLQIAEALLTDPRKILNELLDPSRSRSHD